MENDSWARVGKSGVFMDFDKLKSYLETLNTIDELEAAERRCFQKYAKMTEKQKWGIQRIFAIRAEHIEYGDEMPRGWR